MDEHDGRPRRSTEANMAVSRRTPSWFLLGMSLGLLAVVLILGVLASCSTRGDSDGQSPFVVRQVNASGRTECDRPGAVRDPVNSARCLQLDDVIVGEVVDASLEIEGRACPCLTVRLPQTALDAMIAAGSDPIINAGTVAESPGTGSPVTRFVFQYRDHVFISGPVLEPQATLFRVYVGDEQLAREILMELRDA